MFAESCIIKVFECKSATSPAKKNTDDERLPMKTVKPGARRRKTVRLYQKTKPKPPEENDELDE